MRSSSIALALAVALGVAACGADSEPDATEPDASEPEASAPRPDDAAAEANTGPPASAAPIGVCRGIQRTAVPEGTNLVLVVNDTMRRDRVGVYGGRAATPHFDAFARKHLLFRRAVSQAPWTKPAVATLFTGRLPSQHGVLDHPAWRAPDQQGWNDADVMDDDFDTLAEVLRRNGYRTAAFVSNPWMEKRFGFDQGFEVYEDGFAEWDAPGEEVIDKALAWLDGLPPDASFFLYVHTIDSHRPYGVLTAGEVLAARERIEGDSRPVPRSDRDFLARMRVADGRAWADTGVVTTPTLITMAYDRGIEDFDRALGGLLDALAAHPAWPGTAVVVTSDHGEALYERGYGNHGLGLHEADLAIPLAARLPGVRSPAEIDCPVGLVDLLPTLCDYLDLRCPAPLAGASVVPTGADAVPRFLVSEGVQRLPRSRSVQNARYKLLFQPDGRYGEGSQVQALGADESPYALYDLVADPEEKRNLLAGEDVPAKYRAVATALAGAMEAVVTRIEPTVPGTAPVDPGLRERLEALGYALPEAPGE